MAHVQRPIFDTAHDPRSGFGLRLFAIILSLMFLLVAAGSAVSGEGPATPAEPAEAAPQQEPAAAPAAEPVRHDDPPADPGYHRLQAALERYRGLADGGGWPQVPDGPAVAPGEPIEPARHRALVARLEAEGYMPPEIAEVALEAGEPVLDGYLERALRHFQERHGVSEDGALGAASLRELNVSAAQRADLIALDLERRQRPGAAGSPGWTASVGEDGEVRFRTAADLEGRTS